MTVVTQTCGAGGGGVSGNITEETDVVDGNDKGKASSETVGILFDFAQTAVDRDAGITVSAGVSFFPSTLYLPESAKGRIEGGRFVL